MKSLVHSTLRSAAAAALVLGSLFTVSLAPASDLGNAAHKIGNGINKAAHEVARGAHNTYNRTGLEHHPARRTMRYSYRRSSTTRHRYYRSARRHHSSRRYHHHRR